MFLLLHSFYDVVMTSHAIRGFANHSACGIMLIISQQTFWFFQYKGLDNKHCVYVIVSYCDAPFAAVVEEDDQDSDGDEHQAGEDGET